MTPWSVDHQVPMSLGFSPGENIGVDCHFLLQGIFPTQELNLCLLNCRLILDYLSHQGSPAKFEYRQWFVISIWTEEKGEFFVNICGEIFQSEGITFKGQFGNEIDRTLWSEYCVPPKFIMKSWLPMWWYWEVGPLRGWLSHEGRCFRKRTNAFIKEIPESSLVRA